jgi:nicotinamide mononucleotide adenylyltransferase
MPATTSDLVVRSRSELNSTDCTEKRLITRTRWEEWDHDAIIVGIASADAKRNTENVMERMLMLNQPGVIV